VDRGRRLVRCFWVDGIWVFLVIDETNFIRAVENWSFLVSGGINPEIRRLSIRIRRLMPGIQRKIADFKRFQPEIKRFRGSSFIAVAKVAAGKVVRGVRNGSFLVSDGINLEIRRLSIRIRRLMPGIQRKSPVFERLHTKIKRFHRFRPFREQRDSAH
jgi:hypothetical protein